MIQANSSQTEQKPQTVDSSTLHQQPLPQHDEVSELSAPLSDVEPETTATAARI